MVPVGERRGETGWDADMGSAVPLAEQNQSCHFKTALHIPLRLFHSRSAHVEEGPRAGGAGGSS